MKQKEINKVEIRNLQKEDYDQLANSFTRVYADGSDVFWTPEQINKLIRIFPEGQIVTVVDDKIVGCALSIIVNYNDVKNDHTYAQVTGNETFDTHTRKGNILYGIEVFIHPDYRGLRLARRMYEYRKELCEKLNHVRRTFAELPQIRRPNAPQRVHRQGASTRDIRPGAIVPTLQRFPRP